MPSKISSSDRNALIRAASALPAGSTERRALLDVINKSAMEHTSEKALKDYLKKHPDADPKNHTVKKDSGGGKMSPQQVDESFKKINKSGPMGGFGFSSGQANKIKKMIGDGADSDAIVEAIDNGGDLPSGASSKTKKLWDYMNEVL